jgi:hypothetical protein
VENNQQQRFGVTMKLNPFLLIVSVTALLCSGLALADPLRLSDNVLDGVTAGTADNPVQGSGGAIVGNNSEATLLLTGTLDLADKAQSGARGLNVVNSSESTVANGVNIWDGKLPDGAKAGENGDFKVRQENVVHQEQRRVALLPSYERSGANRSETWTEDSTHQSSSTSNTSNEALNVETTSSTRNLTSKGEVDTESTVLDQEIKGGQGVAGAGDIGITFAGGQVEFDAHAQAETGKAGLDGHLNLKVTLPAFSVDFNGAGCAVEIGSCNAEGTLDETSDTSSDHSVTTTAKTTDDSSETFVGGGTKDVRSPFSLSDAQAEYIVVDDSKLDVESNYGITLAGSAQADLRALNAVNAAGSAVANAVNISRTPSLTALSSMSLVQSNIIGHSR